MRRPTSPGWAKERNHAFFVCAKKNIKTKENDMRKCCVLTLLCLAFVVPTKAQDMKVVEFKLLEKDLTANTHGTSKLDQNNETAALIKVQTPERGFTFDGGSLGIVATEEHTGEMWLYVPRRAQRLIVKHPAFGVMRDYFYPIPIEGGRTYEMLLDIGVGRYVNFTSQVAGADVYIDGAPVGKSPVYKKYLNYGTHVVRAVKDRYEGSDTVYVRPADEQQLRLVTVGMRDMSDHYGDVSVTVDNKADIYFEGRNVGTGSWKTQLREGSYTVETRKADCDPEKTSFTVIARQRNDVLATPPTPYRGILRVFTRPGGVLATYNGGRAIDLTDAASLPIGTYQMEFTKRGYVTQHHDYTVLRNQLTTDTVTLQRINYIKPRAFYFGGGYTLSALSGLTGILGAVYKNHDLQLSYSFGLNYSGVVYTVGEEQQSGIKFRQNSLAVKYGYQFGILSKLGIVPQIGWRYDTLKGSLVQGSVLKGDGASAQCVSVGFKLLAVPMQHVYVFLSPEYDIAVSKSETYQNIADAADFTPGGFAVTLGVLVNLKF